MHEETWLADPRWSAIGLSSCETPAGRRIRGQDALDLIDMSRIISTKFLVCDTCTEVESAFLNTQAYRQDGVHSFRYFLTKMPTPNMTRIQLMSIMHDLPKQKNAYQLYSGHIWCTHLGQEVYAFLVCKPVVCTHRYYQNFSYKSVSHFKTWATEDVLQRRTSLWLTVHGHFLPCVSGIVMNFLWPSLLPRVIICITPTLSSFWLICSQWKLTFWIGHWARTDPKQAHLPILPLGYLGLPLQPNHSITKNRDVLS